MYIQERRKEKRKEKKNNGQKYKKGKERGRKGTKKQKSIKMCKFKRRFCHAVQAPLSPLNIMGIMEALFCPFYGGGKQRIQTNVSLVKIT